MFFLFVFFYFSLFSFNFFFKSEVELLGEMVG